MSSRRYRYPGAGRGTGRHQEEKTEAPFQADQTQFLTGVTPRFLHSVILPGFRNLSTLLTPATPCQGAKGVLDWLLHYAHHEDVVAFNILAPAASNGTGGR